MPAPDASAAGPFDIGGDLTVNRLGFGAMRLTGDGIWGPPDDRSEAVRVLERAAKLGVNLIDTADSYGPNVSEELIAESLAPYPEGLVVATKAGLVRTGPSGWFPVGRPKYLRQCLELSLRRLDLEYVPLYQLHRIDPEVPAADQFGVLKDMQEEGKIRHVGLSEVSVEEIRQAQETLDVATVQNKYSLRARQHEDVLDYCEAEGIGFIPWNPLHAGNLTGPLAEPGGPVGEAVDRTGATPAQVALAWLLRRSEVMLPIPGTSSVEHLEENLGAAELDLPDDLYHRMTEATAGAEA